MAEQKQLPYEQGTVEARDYVKGWLDRYDAERKQLSLIPEQTSSYAYKRGWADRDANLEHGKQTSMPMWQPTPFLGKWFF